MRFTSEKLSATDALQITLREGYGEKFCCEAVLQLLETGRCGGKTTFIFNFENVDIEDSGVFRPLLACFQQLQASGGALRVRGLHGRAREVFELLTLDSLIPVDAE